MYWEIIAAYTPVDNNHDYYIEAKTEGFVALCDDLYCTFKSDPYLNYEDAEDCGRGHLAMLEEESFC